MCASRTIKSPPDDRSGTSGTGRLPTTSKDPTGGATLETDTATHIRSEDVLGPHYIIHDKLGNNVYKIENEQTKIYLVAKLYKKVTEHFGNFYSFKKSIESMNLIKMAKIPTNNCFDIYNDYYCHTYNYIDGINLDTYVKEENNKNGYSKEIKDYLPSFTLSLLKTLGKLHENGIYHRDLCPSNIILRNKSLKDPWLIDFDIASFPSHPSTGSGTAGFSSPEHSTGTGDTYGPYSDFYCLGLILAYILEGGKLKYTNRRGRLDVTDLPDPWKGWIQWMVDPIFTNRTQNAKELINKINKSLIKNRAIYLILIISIIISVIFIINNYFKPEDRQPPVIPADSSPDPEPPPSLTLGMAEEILAGSPDPVCDALRVRQVGSGHLAIDGVVSDAAGWQARLSRLTEMANGTRLDVTVQPMPSACALLRLTRSGWTQPDSRGLTIGTTRAGDGTPAFTLRSEQPLGGHFFAYMFLIHENGDVWKVSENAVYDLDRVTDIGHRTFGPLPSGRSLVLGLLASTGMPMTRLLPPRTRLPDLIRALDSDWDPEPRAILAGWVLHP